MSIEVVQISKKYGTQIALRNIQFKVEPGEIVGFLGPNGAGKSTLMKILTTYIAPDEGKAIVNGYDVATHPQEVRKSVGYLPEHNPLYLDMYVREYLSFNASIYHVATSRIQEVIDLTGLQPEQHKKIGQLSKGYRQRVGIATALLHDPQVLILDEPTTGLDPNQLIEIRDLIRQIGKDKTVFLSTHIMQEVEAICDRVIIINQGTVVTDNKLKQLLEEQTVQIIEVEIDQQLLSSDFDDLPSVIKIEAIAENTWLLSFATDDDARIALFDYAQKKGFRILQQTLLSKKLEHIFIEKTKKN